MVRAIPAGTSRVTFGHSELTIRLPESIANRNEWWVCRDEAGVSVSPARSQQNVQASREGLNSPMRCGTNEVKWWAHQDLNLGPIDYESTALTN